MKKFLIKTILFVFIILSGLNRADAVIQGWVPPEGFGENDSFEIGINSREDLEGHKDSHEKMNIEDIFGSEQVFPFPPGLGN
tara:strand:- start:26 stop:271 length:246 start_codon:yes stop_codon:yes gene_type:complete